MTLQGATSRLPGIFDYTPLTRRVPLLPSNYIRAMHPKTEIRPTPEAIRKILSAGWVGQPKIHGHRAQLHVPADDGMPVLAYTRQARPHKKLLPEAMVSELRRLFSPRKDWNVIDAEWLKPEGKLCVFDFLKREGEILSRLTYPERWKLLPRAFISPVVTILPMLTTLEKCLEALASKDENVEGLVFKAASSPGFSDTSIIRCRRR
jgi:ATP-dependent DNA ligase